MPTEPQLLTPPRLEEITQRVPAIPRAQMSLLEQDRADLLAHIDAQNQAFADYQQQVKAELAALLMPEPTDAEYHSEIPVRAAIAAGRREYNQKIREITARLGLSLTE